MCRHVEDTVFEITKSEWYHHIRSEISPSENIRLYRELHHMSQTELGEKLGRLSRQNISNMENGQRGISKSLAKRLSKLFDVSVEKFL
jgi:transcriptional regulator with XRE-family HTH domain